MDPAKTKESGSRHPLAARELGERGNAPPCPLLYPIVRAHVKIRKSSLSMIHCPLEPTAKVLPRKV